MPGKRSIHRVAMVAVAVTLGACSDSGGKRYALQIEGLPPVKNRLMLDGEEIAREDLSNILNVEFVGDLGTPEKPAVSGALVVECLTPDGWTALPIDRFDLTHFRANPEVDFLLEIKMAPFGDVSRLHFDNRDGGATTLSVGMWSRLIPAGQRITVRVLAPSSAENADILLDGSPIGQMKLASNSEYKGYHNYVIDPTGSRTYDVTEFQYGGGQALYRGQPRFEGEKVHYFYWLADVRFFRKAAERGSFGAAFLSISDVR